LDVRPASESHVEVPGQTWYGSRASANRSPSVPKGWSASYPQLSAVASASFVYLALFSTHVWLQGALTNRFVVYTGTISYALYLWHQTFIKIYIYFTRKLWKFKISVKIFTYRFSILPHTMLWA